MPYGYRGKILHVDLTIGTISTEEPDELFYRRYMGGKGFAGYYLNRLVPADADPLGPENVLVFATGVVVGTPGPGMNRFTVAAKSPLTRGWGEGEAGGFWAPELKSAGFDAIVVRGKSPSPVYLWLHDGEAEIRPAGHLWGLDTGDSQMAIRQELGDPRIRVAQIGPGGENLVRYACVVNELRHFNGRPGMGAVMGSKNLKAVAVRGHGKVEVKDPETLGLLVKEFARQVGDHPSTRSLMDQGTPGMLGGMNAGGMLPTRNFISGTFEEADKIDFTAYAKIQTGHGSCYACPVHCKRDVAVQDDRFAVDPTYGGPEYETLGSFGSCCGVGDLAAIVKANELCNRYTVDTISAGVTIAWAMECFERGLITTEDTGGIELRFGNAEALLTMVEQIARRQGFGALLAEGSRRAAEIIGRGTDRYAIQVKGAEVPMHEPRGKYSVALGYAIGDVGADHLMAPHDPSFHLKESVILQGVAPLGVLEPVDLFDMGPRKAKVYTDVGDMWTLWKVLGVCNFTQMPRSWQPLHSFIQMFEAITGWDSSLYELTRVARRAEAMSRMFNVRCGLGPGDDMLPERFFEPLEGGILAERGGIPRESFESTLEAVYRMKGWDPATAAPTQATLYQLDLDWLTA